MDESHFNKTFISDSNIEKSKLFLIKLPFLVQYGLKLLIIALLRLKKKTQKRRYRNNDLLYLCLCC